MDRTVLEGDPHAVLEGMLIGAYAIGACEGLHLRPQRVSAGHRNPPARHRRGREARPAGRQHLRQRMVVPRHGAARGGRLYLRRRNRADRIAGRTFGRAADPSPLSGHQRAVGKTDRGEQREDLGQRGPHPHPRRRLVRRHGDQADPGHHDLLAGRRGEERRAGGSALRHLAPRADLRDRRRDPRRPAAEGPPGRRGLARLHPALDARPAHRHRRPRRARRS